jgi:hypothetical protein
VSISPVVFAHATAAGSHALLRSLNECVERGQPRHNVHKGVRDNERLELKVVADPAGQTPRRLQVGVEQDVVSALAAHKLLGQAVAARGKYHKLKISHKGDCPTKFFCKSGQISAKI